MMSGILLPWMVNGRSGFRQIYPLLLIAHPIAVVCSQLHSNLVYCDMYRPPPKLTNLICGALLQGKKVYTTLYPIQFPKRRPDININGIFTCPSCSGRPLCIATDHLLRHRPDHLFNSSPQNFHSARNLVPPASCKSWGEEMSPEVVRLQLRAWELMRV